MLAALAIRIQVSLGSVILNYSNRDPQTTAGSLRGFKSKLIITQGKYKKNIISKKLHCYKLLYNYKYARILR